MVLFLKSIAGGIFTLEDGEDGSGDDGSATASLELGSTGEQQLWDRIVIVLHSTKGIALITISNFQKILAAGILQREQAAPLNFPVKGIS